MGGFDLIYKNNKRIKNGVKNVSFLGCFNNRMMQMPKLAKGVALRLAEKHKDDKAKEAALQLDKARNNKNDRNKSTNIPAQQQPKNIIPNNNPNISLNANIAVMNRSGNGIRKPENVAIVKLPKVPTIASSSVSNSSMKAIKDGGMKKPGTEGGSKEEKRL